MALESFSFRTPDKLTGLVGLNITDDPAAARPQVDVFALRENLEINAVLEGDHFLDIARSITSEYFGKAASPGDCDWTLTVGRNSCAVDISSMGPDPYRISFSDKSVYMSTHFDKAARRVNLADYARMDNGPVRLVNDGDGERNKLPAYAAPSRLSENGFFFMSPHYNENDNAPPAFKTVLADAKKLMEALYPAKNERPRKGDKGRRRQEALNRLETNAPDNPYQTGIVSRNRSGGLYCTIGAQDMPQAINALDLPYLPISVARQEHADIQRTVGYHPPSMEDLPEPAPMYGT